MWSSPFALENVPHFEVVRRDGNLFKIHPRSPSHASKAIGTLNHLTRTRFSLFLLVADGAAVPMYTRALYGAVHVLAAMVGDGVLCCVLR